MAEGDIGSVQGELEFETGTALYPRIVHVAGNVYAVAYYGPGEAGTLQAVSISGDGATLVKLAGALTFYGNAAHEISLIHVAGTTFAVAYRDESGDGCIRAVSIAADGSSITSLAGYLEFDTVQGKVPCLIQIKDTTFAVVYWGPGNDGFLKSLTIAADGSSISLIATLEFDTVDGNRPWIIHVAEHVFAIAYSTTGTKAYIKTVTISDDGATLALVTGGTLAVHTAYSPVGTIIRAAGNVFAVTYWDISNDGWVRAVSISDDGTTLVKLTGVLEFDEDDGKYPDIIHISGNAYTIALPGNGSDGWLKGVTIAADGSSIAFGGGSVKFGVTQGLYPNIMHIAGSIYAIAYRGPDNDGWIKTVEIETLAAAAVKHLMLVGIG